MEEGGAKLAKKKVFLSYAREDGEFAKRLYADLKKAGANPWLDQEDLLPGQNFQREIENAIKSCDYFISILSSRSVDKRGYVQRELKQAIDVMDEFPESRVYIIPARLDECKPTHVGMESLHWVDLFPSYENGLAKILRLICPSHSRRKRDVHCGPIEREDDLAETGWGVIFAENTDGAVKDALRPLLEHRREQACRRNGQLYKELTGDLGYQSGDSLYDFLARHGAGPGPVDPSRLPYYLLIVGGPERIPFAFQQQLSIQYRVGRLSFREPQDYANYVRSVLEAERRGSKSRKRAVFFGVKNPGDEATEIISNSLVQPLARSPVLSFRDWRRELIAEDSSKARLRDVLAGKEAPQLLFIASHSMVFRKDSPMQRAGQGAIVCGDWPGPSWREGPVPREFYFTGEDLASEADLTGMIAFHFGCYGAGTPRSYLDRNVSEVEFVSSLAQRCLSNPGGGALAFIGQTGLGWLYSFLWRSAGPQIQTYEYALRSLMKGEPVGLALRYFSQRYAEIAAEWSHLLQTGHEQDEYLMYLRWAATGVKTYVIIGDPAVRIL